MAKNSKTLNSTATELSHSDRKIIAAKLRKSMRKLGIMSAEQANCQNSNGTIDEMQIFSEFYQKKPNSNVAFAKTVEKIAFDKKCLKRTDPIVIMAVRAGLKEVV